MRYKIVYSAGLEKNVKDYGKRYRNVKVDLEGAIRELLENPYVGDEIPEGCKVRKLRVRNRDARKGKSGGYRLIYYIHEAEAVIYVLLLYAKSDRSNVTEKELRNLLGELDL